MPHRRAARLRVTRADAERLRIRSEEIAALMLDRMGDSHRRAVATALLVQQSRSRIRRSMWLSRSA